MNHAVSSKDRRETKSDSEFLELDGNGVAASARAALKCGIRKLTAGQEAGFFPRFRHYVRLSENLKQILRLQGLNSSSQVYIWVKQKNIQGARQSLRGTESFCWITLRPSDRESVRDDRSADSTELLRGKRADRFAYADR